MALTTDSDMQDIAAALEVAKAAHEREMKEAMLKELEQLKAARAAPSVTTPGGVPALSQDDDDAEQGVGDGDERDTYLDDIDLSETLIDPAARQHNRVITTAGDHDISCRNHNKNIPCGL